MDILTGFYFRSFFLFLYCVLFASLLSLKLWILCLDISPGEITVGQVSDDGRKFRDLQEKPQRHKEHKVTKIKLDIWGMWAIFTAATEQVQGISWKIIFGEKTIN